MTKSVITTSTVAKWDSRTCRWHTARRRAATRPTARLRETAVPRKKNDEHGQGTGDGANPPADEVVQARACDGDIVQEVERPRVASPCFLHTVVGPECRGIQIKEKTRIEKASGVPVSGRKDRLSAADDALFVWAGEWVR